MNMSSSSVDKKRYKLTVRKFEYYRNTKTRKSNVLSSTLPNGKCVKSLVRIVSELLICFSDN